MNGLDDRRYLQLHSIFPYSGKIPCTCPFRCWIFVPHKDYEVLFHFTSLHSTQHATRNTQHATRKSTTLFSSFGCRSYGLCLFDAVVQVIPGGALSWLLKLFLGSFFLLPRSLFAILVCSNSWCIEYLSKQFLRVLFSTVFRAFVE